MIVGKDYVKVTAVVRLRYVCRVCGKVQAGDTITEEHDGLPACQAHQQSYSAVVHAMPVGWAHYGNFVFECPDHH